MAVAERMRLLIGGGASPTGLKGVGRSAETSEAKRRYPRRRPREWVGLARGKRS
jgi:hypothetical protein